MERMLVSGAASFADLEVNGHVVAVGVHHPYESQIRAAGYSVSTTREPLRSPRGRHFLKRVFSEFQPDVVHLHTEGNYLQNVLAIKRVDRTLPIVRTVHNVFAARGKWFVSRLLQATVADRLVHAVVVPSRDVALNEKRFGRRVRVIYNWVDSHFFELAGARASKQPPGTLEPVVIVGNCSWIKNHDLVLQAALLGRLHVAHVGSEEHAESSEKRILEQLERAGLLLARGPGDPSAALVGGGVFAMPSLNEGMPVALAEALVVGLPAVVADAPGLRWSASEPGVRMLSKQGPAAWAEALRTASRDDSTLTIDFHPRRGTAEYAEVYRAITTRHGGAK
ncbi:glycosyltransferase [Curtobacterium sp. MCPF17_011]|uniref:glycosyltransferase n=1 Tax=Curtobacterium sp. MCPF17_011 TaxID=2175652 RepID=UPI0015E8BA06|nr:glycosyltransferase [Curtobacterium sp. MCPF17_011]